MYYMYISLYLVTHIVNPIRLGIKVSMEVMYLYPLMIDIDEFQFLACLFQRKSAVLVITDRCLCCCAKTLVKPISLKNLKIKTQNYEYLLTMIRYICKTSYIILQDIIYLQLCPFYLQNSLPLTDECYHHILCSVFKMSNEGM